jgi:hypothetical protein
VNQKHATLRNARDQLAHIKDTVYHAKETKRILQECIDKVVLLQTKIPPESQLSHERMRKKFPRLSRLVMGSP